jgi:hypothetical protein
LGYEKATHCLPRDYSKPNTDVSDLFALGSTLYDLIVGQVPYNELYPVEPEAAIRSADPDVIPARIQRTEQANSKTEALYAIQVFPDVYSIFGGDVILGCWKGEFSSTKKVLLQYNALAKGA